jgi:Domain of unknown function (DU1801)
MANASTPPEVQDYFDALDAGKRAVVLPVFETIRDAMPAGYRLGMQWRMPGWVVPLDRFPDTYNKLPLAYVSLAAQKSYNSLYLMAVYSDPEEDRRFRDAWAHGGRKLDMGKSCLRFRRLADVDLELVAETVAAFPVERFLAVYDRIRD